MSDDGEKSFDPTPQRREQFRKDGRYARSRDASAIAATAGVIAALLGSREAMSRAFDILLARTLGDVGAVSQGRSAGAFTAAAGALGAMALPALFAAVTAGTVAGIAQAGVRVDLDAIGFKPERLDPSGRIKQLVSWKHGLTEVALAIARVGVVGYVGYRALMLHAPALLALGREPVAQGLAATRDSIVAVVLSALGALAIVAAIDWAQSWLTLEREMKMTRKEITDETRSSEGDQKTKGRMRQRARAMMRKRSLANVKKADVIVVNPTHIAVALRYGPGDPAPVVLAKGHDQIALQIRAEARRHGIPILENRPLARALDAEVAIGAAIPAAHFTAVARVLAWVYKLRRRGRGVAGTQRA